MRHLKPGVWHGAIWILLALASAGVAVHVCLRYNAMASTDLTIGCIVWIGIAVLSGPMANFQAGETFRAALWIVALGSFVLASLGPFILWNRPVTTGVFALFRVGFFLAACLRFAGSLVSLKFVVS